MKTNSIKTMLLKAKLILALLLSMSTLGNAQHIAWVAESNGYLSTTPTLTSELKTDQWGNVYSMGYFDGQIDLDPGPIDVTSDFFGGLYIQKLDPNGNLIWYKTVGSVFPTGYSHVAGHGLYIDELDNVYMCGNFKYNTDFDPGPGLVILSPSSSTHSDAFVLKLDAGGNFVWVKHLSSNGNENLSQITLDATGNIYVGGSCDSLLDVDPGVGVYNITPTGISRFLLKLNPNGDFVWAKNFGQESYFSIVGNTTNSVKIATTDSLITFSPSGVQLSSLYYTGGIPIYDKVTDGFGARYIVNNLQNPSPGFATLTSIEKINSNGTSAWKNWIQSPLDSIGDPLFLSIGGGFQAVDSLGNVYISGVWAGTADFDPGLGEFYLENNPGYGPDYFILKLNSNGEFEWVFSIPNDDLFAFGTEYFPKICIDDVGNAFFRLTRLDSPFYLGTAPNLFPIDYRSSYNYDYGTFTAKIAQSSISGRITHDANNNCLADSLEIEVAGVVLQFVNSTMDTFYTTTNSQGYYSFSMTPDTYTISVVSTNPYVTACLTSQQVTMGASQQVTGINWALQTLISCPLLSVDISAPFLRVWDSYYTVSYANHGTVDALNAYVEVELDPYLNYLGSSLPLVSQNGNIYTFNVGTVGVEEYGSFYIQVAVDTSAVFEQTHCTEAHIYPDSICIPSYWNGAIIEAEGICQNDTVFFKLKNVGAAPLSPKSYSVFEDHIIMRIGNTGTIPPNDSIIVPVVANIGKSYRIAVNQEAGFPPMLGDLVATAAIEGCVPDSSGNFNTGFITQFSNGNSSPFIAVDCQQSIGSFDPNDKAAQPAGYNSNFHYIYDYTDLDYKIRFQNTGTDTAFYVVVRDTISPYLDLATLEMGASSHNYTWRIYNDRILEVTFSNIMLPDSNVNEPLSHGFFKYRINQTANNADGTIIYNSAGIYFDFNAPVLTNQTWHTIGDNFVTIILSVDNIVDKTVEVLVYPNPFSQTATIEVKGKDYNELNLSIFDVTGRVVAQEQAFGSNKIQVNKGAMQTGIYFYKLEGDGKLINSGKLILF